MRTLSEKEQFGEVQDTAMESYNKIMIPAREAADKALSTYKRAIVAAIKTYGLAMIVFEEASIAARKASCKCVTTDKKVGEKRSLR
mgnify:FL=1